MTGARLQGEALADGWVRIEISDWTVQAIQELMRVRGAEARLSDCRPSARKGFWLVDVDRDVALAIAKLDEDPEAALRVVLSGQVGRA